MVTKATTNQTITVDVPKSSTGTELVVVNKPFWSKINWTQFVGAAAMLGSYFGLDISPENQAQVVIGIGLATQGLTWVLRTFFTNNQPSVG